MTDCTLLRLLRDLKALHFHVEFQFLRATKNIWKLTRRETESLSEVDVPNRDGLGWTQ